MNHTVEKSKRIAINTLMLYIRMLLVMVVSLYTSRVVLNYLGVTDFGIYSAVGGFVAIFGVVTNSLSASISRYLTYELGRDNKEKLVQIFSASIQIQILFALFLIALGLTVGLPFITHKMTIPPDRMSAAHWVFILSVLSFCINLIAVPYNALIVAHERMKAFAYIGVVESFGRLTIAFLISRAFNIDRLILYSVLMCMLSIGVRMLYSVYCKRNFAECKFTFTKNFSLLKEIFQFSGWNFIGAASGVLKEQGVNVLLNIFCGPAVNAARGIAVQIRGTVGQFSQSFVTSINPQITKTFATDDKAYSFSLVYKGSRFSAFLLWLFTMPLLLETPIILKIWLGELPSNIVIFTRLILVDLLIESLSYTLINLMLATGNIRNYQIIVGGLLFLNFPVSWILLKFGLPPYSVYLVSITIAVLCLVLRLVMLRGMVGISISQFVKEVILKVLIVFTVSSILPIIVCQFSLSPLLKILAVSMVSLISSLVTIYALGCTTAEKNFVKQKLRISQK